jgi:predicted ATPase
MRQLPSGTVTFLFTDVEESTRLLQELGTESYAAALAHQRRVSREAFGRHGGVEVDTQGDSFFVAFPTASGALAAAADVGKQLAHGPIRVRIGVHTGTPSLTDEGYVGLDVHRAARIAAAGHGGQVLLSASTASLVEAELHDLGEHRLKDLSAPERIYQLGTGGFAPLRTLYRSNLPVPATPFLGRGEELAAVSKLVQRREGRLVTLTGPGGTGKTRLALQAAGESADWFPDGVWWVSLSALRDPTLVAPTIAHVLGASNGLSEHIGVKRMLLVLDSFEHLLGAAVEAGGLVAACPNLGLLVTSRERLRLAAEQEYPVPPLASPEGVALFADRARALQPGFQPDAAVEQLCERLDNLPLALELAAARTKVLSPAQLLERLGERLDLFEGGRDADPRQRTLRTTIEWSHDLLTEAEKKLFARLSVFAGSWTLAAAHEVCAAGVDSVASLVDKSLVRPSNGRFYLLETIREYARERLDDHGARDSTTRALANYLLGVERSVGAPLTHARVQALRNLMGDELDNLRVATDWALAAQESQLALQLALAARFAPACLPPEQGRWLDECLGDRSSLPPRMLAEALRQAGVIANILGDQEKSLVLIEESLSLYREHGEERDLIGPLSSLGMSAIAEGDHERARALFEESLELATRHSDSAGAIRATHSLGELELQLGNLGTATELIERSANLARGAGDEFMLTNIVHGLGDVALASGDSSRAAGFYIESLRISRRVQYSGGPVYCVAGLAAVAALESDVERAGRLWGSVTTFEREGGRPLLVSERRLYEGVVNRCAEATPVAFAAAVERGRRMSTDEAVEYAMAGVSAS